MKKQFRSILCLLLCLTMLGGSILPAFAAEGELIDSGYTNSGLRWELRGSVLTLSGSGDTGYYSQNSYGPWAYYDFDTLKLEEGITSISDFTFNNLPALETVYIPLSVTYLSPFGFWWCDNIQDIYYAGTRQQWEALNPGAIASLQNANVHFGSYSVAQWYQQDGYWRYSVDGVDVTGWQDIDGKRYYFDHLGRMQTGWLEIDGCWYFLNSNGSMHTGWLTRGSKTYYMKENGVMATGYTQVEGRYYFFDGSGSLHNAPTATGWVKLGSSWFYLNADGSPTLGWGRIGGKYYWFGDNGIMVTGWVYTDGKEYFMGSSGALVVGWYKVDGIWYYFGGNGAKAVGWYKVNGKWYWFNDQGQMQTGILYIGGNPYHLAESGALYTGWYKQDDLWFYSDASGIMAIGLKQIGGKTYYFNSWGAMLTGWQDIDGNIYLFSAGGAMYTGWYKEQDTGTWYYFTPEGPMATGMAEINGQYYLFTPSGEMLTGWIQDSDYNIYYAHPNGVMATGWTVIDGESFYFTRWGTLVVNAWVDNHLVNEYGVWVDTCAEKPDHKYYKHLTTAQANQADAIAQQIAREALAQGYETDLEKVAYACMLVNNYVNRCTYENDANYYYRSPYGVFVAGVYTCAGATRAMGRVLDYMGYTWYHFGEDQYSHQWVCLRMDGEVGWVDAQIGYLGFGGRDLYSYGDAGSPVSSQPEEAPLTFFPADK